MDEPLHKPPPNLGPFEVGEVFQISDRGAVALADVDPNPWWPVANHRVRITPPGGEAFEAEAHVEALRSRESGERMALLLVHVAQAAVPLGSRIESLGYASRITNPEVSPFPKPWWQFWK